MARKTKPALPYINVGCGDFRAEGYVNIDITSVEGGPQPDIVASALDLPFTKGSVERIYAGHVLEHLAYEDVSKALAEFKRVLKKDGLLMVVGPDADRARTQFPEMLDKILYGDSRWPGDTHLWPSTESATLNLILAAGWSAMPIPITSPALNDWPLVSDIGWQFAIAATPLQPEDVPGLLTPEPEVLEGTIVE